MNDSVTSLQSDVINPNLFSVVTLIGDVINSTQKSVFERYTWTELLAVHGPTALQIDRIITPVWYVIGCLGNTLAAVVWLQKRMRTNNSSAVYLVALSASDLLFLILHLVLELQYAWSISTLHYPVICETYFMFYLLTQYLSPTLVLGFTVERYIAVCHPFRKERLCQTGRARKVVLGLFTVCFLLAAIQAYFWTYDSEKGECRLRTEASSIDSYESSLWSVWAWISEVTVFLAVPLVILVFNALVIAELRRIERRPSVSGLTTVSVGATSRTSSAHKIPGSNAAATTLMLLSVSFYVIVTTLPATLVYVLEDQFQQGPYNLTDVEISADCRWQRYFQYITVRKVIEEVCLSHYACNVFLYLATGRQFRRTLIDLLLRRKHRKSFDVPASTVTRNRSLRLLNPITDGRNPVEKGKVNDQFPKAADLLRTSSTDLPPEGTVFETQHGDSATAFGCNVDPFDGINGIT